MIDLNEIKNDLEQLLYKTGEIVKKGYEDKNIIKFIRTQLEEDWRKPLIKFLNELSKKYNK
ncbi:MAG: hypothetical protein PHZ07_03400 [Patescibacteria group bacterium]|nr:hypothetical protein [Patescibacteria group bacterium]MDD4304410.1 hypothetical protein [Patescibacteria group bacterium]MDD4695433.1 hypothetical protein [Patescibacteria group bacterium]